MASKRQQTVDKLDAVFSQYIRLKNAKNRGDCTCYTCGKILPRKKIQNGHFVSRSCYLLRRSEENCRPQCYACNVCRKGNYIEYTRKIIDELGRERVEEMISLKTQKSDIKTRELEEMIEKYKELNKKEIARLESCQ